MRSPKEKCNSNKRLKVIGIVNISAFMFLVLITVNMHEKQWTQPIFCGIKALYG